MSSRSRWSSSPTAAQVVGPLAAGQQDTDGTPGASKPYGRRALILGAAAAGAGITADLVAGARPAQAAELQGTPVYLGTVNLATAGTTIESTGDGFGAQTKANGNAGLAGSDISATGGTGVFGLSDNGIGVYGQTYGDGKYAVQAFDSSPHGGTALYATSDVGAGVYAETAGNGKSGVQGQDTSPGGGTGVYATSLNGTGVYGQTGGDGNVAVKAEDLSPGGGYAIYAHSAEGTAVYGVTTGNRQLGVYGVDAGLDGGIGVFGNSIHGTGVFGESLHGTAVFGQTAGNGQVAVQGVDLSARGGTSVKGTSANGTGVSAVSTAGIALDVAGVARFSRSGTATVDGTTTRARTSVKVTGVALTAASMILATPQAHHAGVGVAAAVPDVAAESFTIYLTGPVKAAVKVAWFIIG